MLSAGPGTPRQSAGGSRCHHHHHRHCFAHLWGGQGPGLELAGETSETWFQEWLCPPSPQLSVLDKEGVSRRSSGLPTDSGPALPPVPGQREPNGQGVAVELSAGRAALVGAALQKGVLVAV